MAEMFQRFDTNALSVKPNRAVLADIALGDMDVMPLQVKELTGMLALGAKYSLVPAFGFKLTGAAYTDKSLTYADETAVAAGLFGTVLGLDYDVKAVLDRLIPKTRSVPQMLCCLTLIRR